MRFIALSKHFQVTFLERTASNSAKLNNLVRAGAKTSESIAADAAAVRRRRRPQADPVGARGRLSDPVEERMQMRQSEALKKTQIKSPPGAGNTWKK